MSRLEELVQAESVGSGTTVAQGLVSAEIDFLRVRDALSEIEAGVRHFRDLEKRPVTSADLDVVHDLKQQVDGSLSRLGPINAAAKELLAPLFSQSESGSVFERSELTH